MPKKFEYAPGLPGYGTRGVDGSAGETGLSSYFCAYDGDNDAASIRNRILANNILFPGSISLPDGRTYQRGDIFIDKNAKIYEIDFIAPNYFSDTGIRINTTGIFEDSLLNSDSGYDRYSNLYGGTSNILIDNVMGTGSVGNYTQTPAYVYGNSLRNYGQIKFVDVPDPCIAFYSFVTYTSGESDDDAFSIVKEIGSNKFRIGNTSDASALIFRNTELSLDFAEVQIAQDLSVGGNIYGNVVGTIVANSLDLPGYLKVGTTIDVSGAVKCASTLTVTGTIYGNLTGNVTGNVTGNLSGTATNATNIIVADESTDTTCYPVFVTNTTGTLPPKTGTNLSFNSNTGRLTATEIYGGNLQVDNININTATLSSDTTLNITSAGLLSITSTGTTINSNASITGTLGAGSTTISSLRTTGDASISGKLTVTGTLSAGATTLSSLGVTGNASVTGTLGAGATTLSSLGVTGNASVTGTLGVTGNTSITGGNLLITSTDGYIDIQGSGGELRLPDGTVSNPSIMFRSDVNTGFYRYGSDAIGFSLGGSARWRMSYLSSVSNLLSNDSAKISTDTVSGATGHSITIEPGGTISGNAGNLNLISGTVISGTGNGGKTILSAGNGLGSSGAGGDVSIYAGNGSTDFGNAGSISIHAGNTNGTTGAYGGSINLKATDGGFPGSAGNITLTFPAYDSTVLDGGLRLGSITTKDTAVYHLAIDSASGVVYKDNTTPGSDIRIKNLNNTIDGKYILSSFKKLQAWDYNLNEYSKEIFIGGVDTSINKIGLIAQDVINYFPQVVKTLLGDNGDEYYGIDYEMIIPLCVEAIKEQQSEVEELKNIVKNQQEQINKLLEFNKLT